MSQDERSVTVYMRNADESWTLRDVSGGKVHLPSIDCTLDLEAIYADPLGE